MSNGDQQDQPQEQNQEGQQDQQESQEQQISEERDLRESFERSVTHVNPDPSTQPPLSNLDSIDTDEGERGSGGEQTDEPS